MTLACVHEESHGAQDVRRRKLFILYILVAFLVVMANAECDGVRAVPSLSLLSSNHASSKNMKMIGRIEDPKNKSNESIFYVFRPPARAST